MEGFEQNITDYLFKPFSFERFLKAVNKVKSPSGDRLSVKNKIGTTEQRIFFRTDNKHVQVLINDIQFIEAFKNYAKIVTTDQTITVREKISELLEQLPAESFIQVHRSFVVSVKHIQRINGNRITIHKHEIPIGKVYKMNLTNLLK
ncbi:MAG: LytTR family DNA-binding domain-containing protein [Balneolaceae bacterium]